MLKHILIILLLCLNGMARGQTDVKEAYYWFDNQTGRPFISHQVQGNFEVDASSLTEGLHTFHYIVMQEKGGISNPVTCFFLKQPNAQEERMVTCLCTIDGVLRYQEQLAGSGIVHWNLDMSGMAAGIHYVQVDAVASDGALCNSRNAYFMKMSESEGTENSTKGYYWFDEETTTRGEVLVQNGIFEVDASSLSDGFHTFHCLLLHEGGSVSVPANCYFLKTPTTEQSTSLTCLCSIDGQLRHQEQISNKGGVIHWNLDVSDLSEGMHYVQIEALSSDGVPCNSKGSFFMHSTSSRWSGPMQCIYTIDNDTQGYVAGDVDDKGVYHFDHDLTSLSEGLHHITYLLCDSQGMNTTVQTRLFVKTPAGGNGITQYSYWLNDDEISLAQTVILSEKVNPLQLMALLPVDSRPVRSSNFHFEFVEGQPIIYAKNTIHVRFYDVTKHSSDVSKDYADYSKSQEVKPVGELQVTQSFSKIDENDIRWYTMQSASGDTVAFKLSQPATIQLFAPSGAEVFKTSESASVNWGGIHVWEDGTYYLAVHDVTGSRAEMTLEYMHMDKYDVVDWDVHTVGNGGCSTITFKGNGFRDLYAVDLVVAPGDTIHSEFVSHDSDAETAVAFDFTKATLGEYNAVFHFTEEDKPVAKVVTVEEAVDIELATEVSFPSTFLRGTSTTYTIKITNKGNMTSYRTPIYIYIASRIPNGISRVNISGLRLDGIFDGVSMDSLSISEKNQLKAIAEEIGETHYFIQLSKYDEATGDSIYVMSNFFFAEIAPHTEKTITVTISALNQVELWCSVPSDNNPLSTDILHEFAPSRKRIFREKYCCIREKVECIAGVVADIAGLAKKFTSIAPGTPADVAASIADCLASGFNTILKATGNVMCGNTSSVEASIWDQLKMIKDGISGISAIGKCAKNFLPAGQLKTFLDAIMTFTGSDLMTSLDLHLDGFNCLTAFTEKKPNCPPCTSGCGGGGSSSPVPPSDPNDIYGFLSDAGSTFIADSVAKVNYTIEFENDTAFAEASAHTIVIRDTLNNKNFDLRSFQPTGMKLGGREVFLDEAEVMNENGVTSFLKTIDVRPEINAIAQVEGMYNQQTGIAEWRFTSLDPMTMEPTDDLMQGILPVNYDGTSGLGEVMFEVGVKPNKGDGTEIPNRAGIVFDYEEAILTPTWVNTVDAVAPTSTILGAIQSTDSTLTLRLAGEDERSGVWKYNVYAQMGEGASWELVVENTTDTLVDVRIYDGIEYGFLVLATDSAGNVERKTFEEADFQLTTVIPGDANGDGTVDALDVVLVTSYYLGNNVYLNLAAADVNADGEVNSLDVVAIQNIYLNATNGKVLAPRRRKTKHKL